MVGNLLKLYAESHIGMPTIFFVRHLVDFSQRSYNGRLISIFEAPIRSGRLLSHYSFMSMNLITSLIRAKNLIEQEPQSTLFVWVL